MHLHKMLTRLSPTPSGYIHTGNIYNFLLNWLWAKNNNGKVLLRIDDGDAERKRKEYVEDVFRVLEWLGIDWDIGPTGPDDFEKNWSQLLRKNLYDSLLNELAEKDLVFACECSRKQPCNCKAKKISLLKPNTAWKIKVEEHTTINFTDRLKGNVNINIDTPFVIKRKDGIAAYQLCSLADDRNFNVTHICRGEDLLPSTAMQLYIDKHLSSSYFNNCYFWHHTLLTDNDGNKFSKSAGIQSSSIINQIKKEDLLHSFAKWIGLDVTKGITLEEIAALKHLLSDII
jgi:glutamyl/glutaminyl-tRNA synthetase